MTTAMTASRQLEYGFDAAGGFFVLDHFHRMAGYAYPTSDHAKQAKRNPLATAEKMIARPRQNDAIEESYYKTILRASRH